MSSTARALCKSLLLYLLIIPASKAATLQYKLEAAFLFNFTQFVEWPATAFPTRDSPMVIGVLGDDPFGSYLDDIVQGEVVNGHPLVIERYHSASEIRRCHILFFADSEIGNFRNVLVKMKDVGVLTVSNLDNFVTSGGVVRFRLMDNRVRFRINIHAARDAQLAISSKLLKQADIIGDTED